MSLAIQMVVLDVDWTSGLADDYLTLIDRLAWKEGETLVSLGDCTGLETLTFTPPLKGTTS